MHMVLFTGKCQLPVGVWMFSQNWGELFLEGSKGGVGGDRDPMSRTNVNQNNVSRILETAEFMNHLSFLVIFMRHSLIFALFSCVMVKFLPISRVTHKPFATLFLAMFKQRIYSDCQFCDLQGTIV